jgi:hypothetical protein
MKQAKTKVRNGGNKSTFFIMLKVSGLPFE